MFPSLSFVSLSLILLIICCHPDISTMADSSAGVSITPSGAAVLQDSTNSITLGNLFQRLDRLNASSCSILQYVSKNTSDCSLSIQTGKNNYTCEDGPGSMGIDNEGKLFINECGQTTYFAKMVADADNLENSIIDITNSLSAYTPSTTNVNGEYSCSLESVYIINSPTGLQISDCRYTLSLEVYYNKLAEITFLVNKIKKIREGQFFTDVQDAKITSYAPSYYASETFTGYGFSVAAINDGRWDCPNANGWHSPNNANDKIVTIGFGNFEVRPTQYRLKSRDNCYPSYPATHYYFMGKTLKNDFYVRLEPESFESTSSWVTRPINTPFYYTDLGWRFIQNGYLEIYEVEIAGYIREKM